MSNLEKLYEKERNLEIKLYDVQRKIEELKKTKEGK